MAKLLQEEAHRQRKPYVIENQAEVHSNDGEFARFPNLRWVNPIA